jgi:AraC-like DNA-binding protein
MEHESTGPTLRSRTEEIGCRLVPGVPGAEVFTVNRTTRQWCTFDDRYTFCVLPEAWNPPAVAFHCRYRGHQHRLAPGTLTLVEPLDVQILESAMGPASFWGVQLSAEAIASLARKDGREPPGRLRGRLSLREPELHAGLARFRESFDRDMCPLEIEGRLADCVTMLLRLGRTRPPAPAALPRRALRRVRDYLHASYASRVTMATLESLSGMTRFHLIRSFARAYGLPPHTYQRQVRVLEARRQLRAGVPVADVNVGFADQSHLSRHFKRAMGIAPGEYARQVGQSRWHHQSLTLASITTSEQQRSRPVDDHFID